MHFKGVKNEDTLVFESINREYEFSPGDVMDRIGDIYKSGANESSSYYNKVLEEYQKGIDRYLDIKMGDF